MGEETNGINQNRLCSYLLLKFYMISHMALAVGALPPSLLVLGGGGGAHAPVPPGSYAYG